MKKHSGKEKPKVQICTVKCTLNREKGEAKLGVVPLTVERVVKACVGRVWLVVRAVVTPLGCDQCICGDCTLYSPAPGHNSIGWDYPHY